LGAAAKMALEPEDSSEAKKEKKGKRRLKATLSNLGNLARLNFFPCQRESQAIV